MPQLSENNATKARKIDLPMQTRLAAVTTVNEEERTAELVWTTGAPVRRYNFWEDSYYMEELSLQAEHVDLTRLNGGAPLLNTHSNRSLDDVVGVVEKAWINGKEGRALVRFSTREEVEPIFRDVKAGIIRNVSVGYSVRKYERTQEEGKLDIYRATDWEPMELSLVPIGADAGAGVRSEQQSSRTTVCHIIEPAEPANQRKETAMPLENAVTPGGNAGDNTEADNKRVNDATEAARKAEKQRQSAIRECVRTAKLDDSLSIDLIDKDVNIDEARKLVLEQLAERSKANDVRNTNNTIQVIDKGDSIRAAMGEALLHRANPSHKLTDAGREYRGMDLVDMGRECIELAGGKTRGLSKREIAVVALNLDPYLAKRQGMMSTSDFPLIVASTINHTLREAYELAPPTFKQWTRRSTMPDFRETARVQLSELSAFKKVLEGGEYKYSSFGDTSEKYSLSKYGTIIALTWELMINDDLNAFDRIPQAIAAEAAALEGDIVYNILLGNPTMADGVALFHATHANLAGSGGAISDVTLGAARAAMRKQTGINGRVLNVTPDFLIVGPDKEGEAQKYTSAQFVATKQSDIVPNFNTSLTVIVDPRITGNQWYLATTPSRVDTIEYAYLEGEEGIYTETRQGFEVDGVETKVRHVFAAKAIDYRGLYKNPGA